MDKEQAYKIGLAFKLGIIYARGKAHARQLANDDAKWITVHPNGKENKGRPALLDSETGEVLGGMGGKFNGKHISAVPQHGKNEQMGAQMRVNAKNHKADLMNGQKIDFIKNNQPAENTTKVNSFSDRLENRVNDLENTQNKQESITNADFKKYHMPLNHLSKIEKETDKAFLISSNFASGFDGDDIEYQKRSVWVPKSQVSSKNGYVFGMNPKFAKENGFTTQRSRKLAKRLHLPQNNPDIQKNLEETKKADEQRKNNQPAENQIANTTNTYINNIQNEINKAKGNNETLPKFKTHVTVLKVLENLPDGSIIHSQKGGFLRKEKDGSFSALNDQGELVSKNMPLKIDDLYDSSNNWSIGIGKTTEEAQKNTTTFRLDNTSDIGKSKRVEEQKQQANQDYFKKYENSFKDSDGHTTAGLNDIDFDKAVKAFNNSSQDPERRARVLRQDYVSSVNNMYDDLKGRIENKEQQEYLNKEFEKGKQQILKAYNDYLSSESQTASTSVVGKMRSALQARKMNEKQDRAFEKRANIANIVEKIQEKIGDGLWERNNKNLERRNNNNNYLSNVLNKPITNWNGKIYNYKNGEKAVFINNQKIVLNAEQYKKLKELAGK